MVLNQPTAGSSNLDAFSPFGGADGGPGLPEITSVDCSSSSGGNLYTEGDGKGFLISTSSSRIGVWFNVDGVATQPTFVGATTYAQVDLVSVDVGFEIAQKLVDTLQAIFSTVADSGVATLTDLQNGARQDAADVDSGLGIQITQQGS